MRTAADIMTHKPKTIHASDLLGDVMKLFLDQGITSSPVLGNQHEPLGMLSELNLTKAYMLYRSKLQSADKIGHHLELLEPIFTVTEEATLGDVLKEMVNSTTHRLLVKNKSNNIVGIISPKDIMRAMIGQTNASQNIREKLKETESLLNETLEKMDKVEKFLEVYEKAFHETPYMMHAVNDQGILIMANKRHHEMLGFKNGELIGKSIFDIYAKPMHGEAAEGLKKVIKTGHHHVTYTTLLRADGAHLRCDIASSSLHDRSGNFISTISVLRPIDSDEMLRILHGIVDDKNGPLAKYINQAE